MLVPLGHGTGHLSTSSAWSLMHILCGEGAVWNLFSVWCVFSLPLPPYIEVSKYAGPSLLLRWPQTLLLMPGILGFKWHKIFPKPNLELLGNDAATKIWSWSALSAVSTIWKQIVTEKIGIFFSKKHELISLKSWSFWKLFTVYCF